jgi:hypothetical protein
MAQFTNFLDILPSPSFLIGDAGQGEADGGSKAGPGYASVSLKSDMKTLKNRTNSGRYTARSAAYQKWNIDISYNPMTKAQFMPVYTFLLEKMGGLTPFYLSLPQYEQPQSTTFAASAFRNTLQVLNTVSPGATTAVIRNGSYNHTTNGKPTPGDLFTVTDPNDSNHKKAYMITRVEDSVDYNTSPASSTDELLIHVTPQWAKEVSTSATLNFSKTSTNNGPLLKVITKDMQEYSLGTNNLYSFKLSLEEVQ